MTLIALFEGKAREQTDYPKKFTRGQRPRSEFIVKQILDGGKAVQNRYNVPKLNT